MRDTAPTSNIGAPSQFALTEALRSKNFAQATKLVHSLDLQ